MVFFAHVAVDAGISAVMQKVKDVINASGKKAIVICPAGITETLIDGGTIFIVFQDPSKRCLV